MTQTFAEILLTIPAVLATGFVIFLAGVIQRVMNDLNVIPGTRYKASQQGKRRIRLVEFAKGFVEPDWCTKGHIGHVLSGEMDVDFDGQVVRFSMGDGLVIPEGEENRHKATVITDVVKLILVEDAE